MDQRIDARKFFAIPLGKKGVELEKRLRKWRNSSFEEKLTIILQDGERSPWKTRMLRDEIDFMLDLAEQFDVEVCSFENLVNERGGGSLENQFCEIKKISEFLGLVTSDQQILQVCENSFGEGENPRWNKTFRSGQIGQGKVHFTSYHQKLFTQIYGEYFVALEQLDMQSQ